MGDKRTARTTFYEGIRQAAANEFATTEENLRKLEGLKPPQIENLIADVRKRHEEMLRRIEHHIREERAREEQAELID